MKKKKPKIVYLEDDGRTLYSMSGLEPFSQTEKENAEALKVELTKKEKKAMRKAAFVALLPMLFCIFIGFGIVYFIIRFWLR
ncbi:MAG: hypothetical protein NC182_00635 [Prevotella sp.]|nr:hypothetical protein [Staphylococcus sp.]MCM1349691.1 hypothetical protein [Prevotella sp.]